MPRILVVDDVLDDLNALRRGAQAAITALGGQVETAGDAESAIHLLKEKRFDVVVTDLQLTPDQNYEGWDVLRYARKVNAATKVIVVSAYSQNQVDVKSISLGALRYMDKIQGDLIEQTKSIVLDALTAG